jgi:D-alanyl-D-alanine carboxypeptidase
MGSRPACGSGYNLIASAKRDGVRLIGVLLGGKTRSGRNSEMVRLLDSGFAGGDAPYVEPTFLADLRGGTPGHETNPPPEQLSYSECTRSPNIVSPQAPNSDRNNVGTKLVMDGAVGPAQGDAADAKQPKLSGWGLIFGAYSKESLARASIKDARTKLKPVLKGGRPAVVKRKWEGVTSYKALLVGLSREQAGSACKHLWNAGAYCLALSPEALNSSKAVWR